MKLYLVRKGNEYWDGTQFDKRKFAMAFTRKEAKKLDGTLERINPLRYLVEARKRILELEAMKRSCEGVDPLYWRRNDVPMTLEESTNKLLLWDKLK